MSDPVMFFTIDLEDWFQVENLKEVVKPDMWDTCEIRVQESTKKLLDLFEQYSTKTTFFVLGWLAERLPRMIQEIHQRGHEVASHGYAHKLIHDQSPDEFFKDIKKTKDLLENLIGTRVIGYRAPSFSITDWAMDKIAEAGYIYDSSFCPTTLHSRYGKLSRTSGNSPIFSFQNNLMEIAIPTVKIGSLSVPWGGGAYFRLIPYSLFKLGIKRIIKRNKYYNFYMHPWEIDYNQPKIRNLSLNHRIRHYTGLKKNYMMIEKLANDYSFTSIKNYLQKCRCI